MKREMKVLIVVLIMFECGYIFRFLADLMPSFFGEETYTISVTVFHKQVEKDLFNYPDIPFYWFAIEDASYIFEGLSYLTLLFYHFKNFTVAAPIRPSSTSSPG